ncbi:PREDICTED: uncharacterized protein LOC105557942 [Vollenhovia emeryi]|uniref:uncharacterized protein LOC105557942 n=1 Tax=Vollenhovia emeryi TaxID=411798 RepID=UPI0005F4AEA3|nr:PREDICTED: uncharacterized protein LOC105557942 [Vollenhovia emeryi]XP_011860752.1 PREDICTED: uncharacterized protein LOC105557942 [Vollenhovia emeryi]XP_011860753.1 PREDICTED: uncharacterized protein LOC105557942 [Vollenhovia emeryi]
MLIYCHIEGCNSTTYKKEKNKNKFYFFGFPTNLILRKKWIEALLASGQSVQRVGQIKKYSRICNLHFATDCIEKNGLSYVRLKPNSVPTIFPNAPTASVADIKNIEPTLSLDTPATSVADIKNIDPMIFPDASTASVAENIEPTNAPLSNMEIDQHEETSNTLSKRMCYAGDIKIETVGSMSPRTVMKSMTILKKTCKEKNKIIKRLRVQLFRQRRKIKNLETLLCELRTKGLLSSTSSDVIQIMNYKSTR